MMNLSILLPTIAIFSSVCVAIPRTSESVIADWIQQNAFSLSSIEMDTDHSDLHVMDSVVRKSQVIAFGEVYHGLHEHPKLRNRLARYLVEEQGVRLIMVESGIFESRLVDRYVLGDPSVTLDEALQHGITHGMGPWEEMKELVVWMREHNQNTKKKVRFVSPDLAVIGDAPVLALRELKPYLEKVDPGLARRRLFPLLRLAAKASAVTEQVAQILAEMHRKGTVASAEIDPDLLDGFGTISFDQMTHKEQRKLETELAALKREMLASRSTYIKSSSRDEFNWNSHLPVVALQMVRNLRSRQAHPKIPFFEKCTEYLKIAGLFEGLKIRDYGYSMTDIEGHRTYFKGRESRERALAENVIWASKLHGKTFIYSHNDHIFKEAVNASLGNSHIGRAAKNEGQFLFEHFGQRYSVITGAMNRYVDESGEELNDFKGSPITPLSQCTDCLELAFRALPKAPAYFVSLASATSSIRALLLQERKFRDQLAFNGIRPAKAYDAILYVNDMRIGRKLQELAHMNAYRTSQ